MRPMLVWAAIFAVVIGHAVLAARHHRMRTAGGVIVSLAALIVALAVIGIATSFSDD